MRRLGLFFSSPPIQMLLVALIRKSNLENVSYLEKNAKKKEKKTYLGPKRRQMRHLGPFLFSQSKWWSWWSWGSRHVVLGPIVVVLKPPSLSLSQFFGKSERREV